MLYFKRAGLAGLGVWEGLQLSQPQSVSLFSPPKWGSGLAPRPTVCADSSYPINQRFKLCFLSCNVSFYICLPNSYWSTVKNEKKSFK